MTNKKVTDPKGIALENAVAHVAWDETREELLEVKTLLARLIDAFNQRRLIVFLSVLSGVLIVVAGLFAYYAFVSAPAINRLDNLEHRVDLLTQTPTTAAVTTTTVPPTPQSSTSTTTTTSVKKQPTGSSQSPANGSGGVGTPATSTTTSTTSTTAPTCRTPTTLGLPCIAR